MKTEHISSAFDADLEHIQALMLRMGGLVETALHDAMTALQQGDLELAERVKAGDRVIDDLELEIGAEVERVIALRAPTAGDLRTVLSVLTMASTLERCGDYARNMAKRMRVLEQFRYASTLNGTLRRMSRVVESMLADALDAYVSRDLDKARDVIDRDLEVDQLYNSLFRELLTHMMEDPRTIAPAMHLHFIAKNIERVGDHATNLSEQAIYLVTGERPDDARPKQDVTSLNLSDLRDG
ncbi:phosphate signaling complex protein PhoU [Thalassorhabdomicrobium marinisediminis]|uniref:Phosphate-specific transport system accessory protein PhoU n=1 Tax=Thalassorhabdomicrobium marinisediminis TaxID=2170577 RepID=A0A2T7FT81_9RHOB|nr:phosphate signaling complex protein PhoU [Thalassorhabdomicrobium marinisediminis]PVA05379.1 phosphate transport system regulatory protein PhoU [Thalassorhabdomicrobium marinisediminis]